MAKIILCLFLQFPLLSFCQTYDELGVVIIFKDSVIQIINRDGGYKVIKISERQNNKLVEINLIKTYYFEGDVVHNHKLYTKEGEVVIEIKEGEKMKTIVILRNHEKL
ncbi:hypothetical protein [Flavobacterium saliperosum]|uniref:Uncharacterized protein n=1 Tax=Flavobacterium saliperosum TaxID=329186 RepID=A0A1G4V2X9_9FLAO|nr:hypothetical protein [Flavobacterium saliperosum]SCX00398.1 hypothetical protein SAMN02927925_00154 [Flavobacterium saliperosum]